MNLKYLQFFALLFCALIVSIPITFAAELKIIRFGGALSGAENFVTANDDIIIKAAPVFDEDLGDLSKEEIEGIAKRLKVSKDNGQTYDEFQSCVKEEGKIVCTYEEAFDDFYQFMFFNISLFDELGKELTTETRRALLDAEKPFVAGFSSNYNKSGENKLELSYKAEDYSNSSRKTDYCSGIKEINFTVKGNVIKSIGGNASVCSKSGSFVYEHSMESNFESFNICVQAFDFVGFKSDKKCLQTTVDQGVPLIYGLKIKDSEGYTLSHVKPDIPASVDIFATIEDDNLRPESVSADFSRLNPNLVLKKYDELLNGNVFVWRNVVVNSPQTCEVIFFAKDLLNNSVEKTLSCSIKTDARKPWLLAIYTKTTSDEGLPLLASGEKFFADIQDLDDLGDAGSGFGKKNVFMGLDALGIGKKQADECVQSGNIWKCSWNVASSIEGSKKIIRLEADSRDDLGNSVENPFERIIEFDNIPPEILDKNFRILHKSQSNETVAGDSVEMRITASDVFEAFGNFSELGGGERASAVCEGGKTKTCLFTSEILASGPYTGDLAFDLLDKAGNKASIVQQVSVFGVSDVKNPNFWNVKSVSCTPKLIDRSTANLREQKVYCYARLSPINPRVKITPVKTTFLGPTECTPFDLLSRFVQNIDLTNNGFGSRDLYLEFTLKPADYTVNELQFSCPVSISTKTDVFTTANPEVDNIDVKLQFYNLPVGELNANIERKIEKEIDSAGGALEWMNVLQKVMDVLSKTCQIKSVISSLIAALDVILLTLGINAAILTAGVLTSSSGLELEAVRAVACAEGKGAVELAYDSIFGILDEACMLTNCALTDDKNKDWSISMQSLGKFGTSAGGGISWCADLQGYLKDLIPGSSEMGAELKKKMQVINVKESIVWSTACLCIPGIIHNINKYRQINCRTALCYARDVRDYGVPSFHCDDVKAYMTCSFVFGEIFNMIPFLNLINDFMNMIKEAFVNPLAIVAIATGLICTAACKWGTYGFVYAGCIASKTISKIGDAVGSISSMATPDYWRIGTHYCDELQKVEKNRKQKPKEVGK